MEQTPEKILTVESKYGPPITMFCFESLPSVAELAKKYAKDGCADRTCIFSPIDETKTVKDKKGHETAVRGLYLSLILRPTFFPQQAGFMNHLSASAFATTLQGYTTYPIGIGWVSDVFAETEKIGSVNIESRLDHFSGYEYLIFHFAAEIEEKVFPVRLSDLMRRVFEGDFSSQELLMASSLLDKFFALYSDYKATAKFLSDYRTRFVMNGLSAVYTRGGRKKKCKLLGIDAVTGKLRVEMPNGAIVDFSGRSGLILPDSLTKRNPKIKKSET